MNARNAFTLALFTGSALFFAQPVARSEEAATTLATLPATLASLDTELAAAVAAAQKVLEEEIAAGRIKDPVAQALRWSFKGIGQTQAGFEGRKQVDTSRVPSENVTLLKTVSDLESKAAALQGRRDTVVEEAGGDLRKRVGEAIGGAERVEQVEQVLTQVAYFRQAAAGATNHGHAGVCQQAETALRALQGVIVTEGTGDLRALKTALTTLRDTARSSRSIVSPRDLQARIERTQKPFLAAVQTAQESLETCLLEEKPAVEAEAALARFEEASKKANRWNATNESGDGEDIRVMETYRWLVKTRAAIEKGAFAEASRHLGLARTNIVVERSPSATRLVAAMAKWSASIEENLNIARARQIEKVRAQLAVVKTPQELDEVAATLAAAVGKEMRDSESLEGWVTSLAHELSTLATQWSSAAVTQVPEPRVSSAGGARNLLVRELTELQRRAARDSLSQVLRVPELVQPPLLELPLEAAFEALYDDLAKRGEWRRLYRVIDHRRAQRETRQAGAPDPTLAALQSYFAGLNLEVAEQWREAVAAYQAVLTTPSERVPVKEAGERLKALRTAHPEAFPGPAPAGKTP